MQEDSSIFFGDASSSSTPPKVLLSFPVMTVVSALALQLDPRLHSYHPYRTTHSDLQLLPLQGHLDYNHTPEHSAFASTPFYSPSTCLMFASWLSNPFFFLPHPLTFCYAYYTVKESKMLHNLQKCPY